MTGLLLSLVALVWVIIEYVWWFIRMKRTIAAAGLAELPSGIPHAWNLAGVTAWNLVVLLVAVCLLYLAGERSGGHVATLISCVLGVSLRPLRLSCV